MRLSRDLAAISALAALVAARLVPPLARGLAPFWGDLTYIHFPWRAFDAQLLQAGRLPLWDPYLYLGMPAAATMQDSLFYPGTVPFFLFGFPTALFLFHATHFALSGAFAYLWLRALRLKRSAALGGAGLLCLGGVWLENTPFLNHLGVLTLLPALLLLSARPKALAAALAAAFFAGYPPFFVGAAAAACALSALLARRRGPVLGAWAGAGAWAAAVSACLLLPAVELVGLSHRSSGVGLDEALRFGFSPRDLAQWAGPLLARPFDPAVLWWKTCFAGLVGLSAAAWGLRSLPRARALSVAGALAAIVALTLGGSNPVSDALWRGLPPLRFVRYPGNFSYLAVPLLALAAAAGLHALGRWRAAAAAALLLELCAYGQSAFPLARAGIFAAPGPLVRRLQADLEGHRYLLSPLALEAERGRGYEDWKQRLYGLTNAPYRLRAAANFGEPLVPQASYAVMDWLYRAPGPAQAAALFAWADVRILLTPGRLPPGGGLCDDGQELWRVNRVMSPVWAACWLSEDEGAALPAGLPDRPVAPSGAPAEFTREREDRFAVAGGSDEPGWVYISEPRFPGWRATLETPRGAGAAASLPAFSAFQKVHVPAGPWRLDFVYDPGSWRLGLILTLLAAAALAWRWAAAAAETAP